MRIPKRTNKTSELEPIAIIGIGCRFPGGAHDPDSFWDILSRGVDAVTEVPEGRWNVREYYHEVPGLPGKTYSKWGGFVKDIEAFDPESFGVSPREAIQMDPQQRLLLEVSWEALEDAGIPVTGVAGTNTGVFVGISTTDYGTLRAVSTRADGYSATGGAASIAANRISYWLSAAGPSIAVDTACSSALVATHLACQSIWNRESDLALAGGVNAIFSPAPYIAFCAAGMLSPVGRCKAFDASADGFVRAEGAGIVVLKRLSEALANGDPVYATIAGTGVNQDGRTSGIALPNQKAQETLVRAVCRRARILPEHVDYVEAHGTGTAAGDPIEAASLGRVLSQNRKACDPCLIGSVKTNIGHLEAGAGVAGLIKAALVLAHRQIPPSLHFREPNPNIPFEELRLRVPTTLEGWPQSTRVPAAGVNSFGFGGTNAHVVLVAHEENGSRRPAVNRSAGPWLLPLSATSAESLNRLARSYQTFFRGNGKPPETPLADVCYTASVGRAHLEHRLALVAGNHQMLAEQLEAYGRSERRAGMSTGQRRAGQEPKAAFVCSGQGPQWWGMGRQLFECEPVFRSVLQECDALLSRFADWSLLAELSRDEKSSRIQETAIAQPALFALQAGLLALWRSWGVEPEAVIGHSVGEVAAAYAAGALGLEDAVKVIFYRGYCMDTASSRGRMLAVGLPAEEAAALVRGLEDRISLAAVNGPSSSALSGEAEVLEKIQESLAGRGVFCRFLQVSYAFHSPQMEPVRDALLSALEGIDAQPVRLPMISTVTGRRVEGPELTGEYWWQNVRRTVHFARGIGELLQDGCNTFVELSPHPVLSGSIHEMFADAQRTGHAVPSLRRHEDERAQMLGSLGALYTAGYPLDWEKIWPRRNVRVRLPKHLWKRERYWHESDAEREQRLRPGHPLLGRRVTAAQPLFQTTMDKRTIRYLGDHRVQEQVIFPGAGYVEIALAAGCEIFGGKPVTVEQVQFQKALFLSDTGEPPVMQFLYNPDDASYAIQSRATQTDQEWILHAIGYLRGLEGGDRTPALDRQFIQSRMTELPVGELYERFRNAGLQYGSPFQGVRRLWGSGREALASAELVEECRAEAADYQFHPALLDCCFQCIVGALPPDGEGAPIGGLYLPVYIERVRFFSRPADCVWTHVQLRRFNQTSVEADIRVFDEQGACLVEIEGFHCQAVEGYRAESPADWFYETRWYEKPLGEASPAVGSSIPSLRSIVRSVSKQTAALERELGYAKLLGRAEEALNRVAAAYVWQALEQLGVACRPGDEIALRSLIEERRVLPRHERVVRRFMNLLETEYGLQKSGEDRWRVVEDASVHGPEELWQEALAKHPAMLPELVLLNRFGRHLHEVLCGGIDPLTLLFPDGSTELAERFYEHSIALALPNTTLASCLQEILACVPRGRNIRVLEVGAGTGGITSQVLPLLPAVRTQYVFSDISNAFLLKAEQKFSSFPFVEFTLLDIEQDPAAQGFAPGSFDIILASQVFHAMRDLGEALGNVAKLLAPRGVLMFLEVERVPPYTDLLFGLMEGWWKFTDFELRPDYPLISGTRWASLLERVGFEEVEQISTQMTPQTAPLALFARVGEYREDRAGNGVGASLGTGQWLVFADRSAVGEELAALLSQGEGEAVRVMRGETFRSLDDHLYEANPSSLEDIEQLCRRAIDAADFRGVVHLWSLDAAASEEVTVASLRDAEGSGCHSLVHIVQALEKLEMWGAGKSLLCVTRNASPVGGDPTALSVAQSPLLGLGRVIFNEHPNINCRLVDLGQAGDPSDEAMFLLRELSTEDADREVALRSGVRFVPRAQRFEQKPRPIQWARRKTRPRFQLTIPKAGALDRLVVVESTRPAVGPQEIEIEVVAAALNFRDIMKALFAFVADGPDAMMAGDECAGRITRVGKGVKDFRVGDEVIATAPGSFASHVVVHEGMAQKKPNQLSFAEAATMPVAFLTAYYSLVHLAHLGRGEKVLIHSATGGVGLAAVQIARSVGAEVYATAGSSEKRYLLDQMGVRRVMNSRTLAFADEILKATGGRGVDVVLNSLAGHAITKGIACLAPRGRFVELGKRDIYQNSKVGLWNFRKNLSYFAVDLTQLFADQEMMQSLLRQFLQMLREESFHPLPHCVFPMSRAVDAFRFMAQARHVGKIVLAVPDPALRVMPARAQTTRLRSDGTYLITGGYGGYGLTVAEWCVDRGAGCVVLMGRRGAASEEAKSALARLRGRGASVVEARGDVANEREVAAVFERIDRTMPPLRGVFHLAMVLDDSILVQLNPERFTNVTAPKAIGAWNLHAQTEHRDLDLFVCFSSTSALFGSPGQGNYAAANAFLDALAHWRRLRGLPATTIDWGLLEGVGYVARHNPKSELLKTNKGLAPAETMAALDQILIDNPPQIAALRINWSALAKVSPGNAAVFSSLIPEGAEAAQQDEAAGGVREAIASVAEGEKKRVLEAYVRNQLARVLGTAPEKLDATRPLNEVGLDSLMGVEVKNRLERDLAVSLPVGDLMQNPSIEKLVVSLAGRLGFSSDDAIAHGNGHDPAGVALVPLKKGNGINPLFCFHPLGGEIGIYRELAENLPADQSVFGVQSRGFDGKERTLAEMGANYARAIRAQQPAGPYHLLGFSAAGYFAMATAHALETQGEKVRFVAMLDTDIRWTDPELPRQEMFTNLVGEVQDFLVRGKFAAQDARMKPEELSEFVSRLIAASWQERVELTVRWFRKQVQGMNYGPDDDLHTFIAAVYSHLHTIAEARVETVDAPLLVWHAQDVLVGSFRSEATWTSYTRTNTIENTAAESHYGVMTMPAAVAAIAAQFVSIWRDLEGGGLEPEPASPDGRLAVRKEGSPPD